MEELSEREWKLMREILLKRKIKWYIKVNII